MTDQHTDREAGLLKKKFEHWQVISAGLVAFDILAILGSFFLGLWLRFDCTFSAIPRNYLMAYIQFMPFYLAFCLVIFRLLRLYHSIWRFASYIELLRVCLATVVTFLFQVFAITMIFERMPIAYYTVGISGQFFLTLGIRFSYRLVLLLRSWRNRNTSISYAHRVMLIGAGEAGQMIQRDIRTSAQIRDEVCCIIDDNRNKWGRYVDGVPVVGGRDDILSAAEKYSIDKIVFAIPSASPDEKRDILNICKETGCELKRLPGIYQFLTGEIKVSVLKDVAVEDLLGRDPIKVNMEEIFASIRDKVVLITGGGGSIGSELARQVAGHQPKQLILFDVYENNVYSIQLELQKKYPDLDLVVLIGSVRDSRRIAWVYETYHPQITYHAAAHKHVPLMEDSPGEAIKNNAIGTYKTAYAAMMNGCERFVLISTDKAVNPTNIMGASKRLCEMVIQSFDKMIKAGTPDKLPGLYEHGNDAGSRTLMLKPSAACPKTEFVAVRFGNVLGSNGSVIPIFKRQIAAGGPVTVTHPDIIRYFMTIPEAVSLVLQAGAYAHGGEIFVFDMGEPVKIDTLARNLIKLSGLRPDVDIKVEYTGLRPGEKLYEEKLMAEEGMRRTANKLIHIGAPVPFDVEEFLSDLQKLMTLAYRNDPYIVETVEEMVTTFRPMDTGHSARTARRLEATEFDVCPERPELVHV